MIEILTVIAIIAILAGFLFPAIKAAMNKAKGARARTTIQQVGGAFRSYFAEFSVWPTNSAYNSAPFDLTTNLFRNTANITFLDVTAKDIGVSSGTITNLVLDPWRKAYHCVMDGDFTGNGTVANPLITGGTVTNSYIIWSDGPDGTNDSAGESSALNRDNIKSW